MAHSFVGFRGSGFASGSGSGLAHSQLDKHSLWRRSVLSRGGGFVRGWLFFRKNRHILGCVEDIL